MKTDILDTKLQFLAGGGEMGALTRSKDWSQTPVGNPETWPQSLRTTLSIILNSKFPMFLWWGPELICFYNDAYRPSLGENGKHPVILGQPAEQAWPEIWDVIKPLIDQVLVGGEATWSEDQLIPIYRNGKLEDVYWTFSYSPVNDESGRSSGVLVTCNETTGKVKMLQEIKEREDQLSFTLNAAELGTWDLNPATNKFVGNERLKDWFGLPPEAEIELSMALNAIVEKDRQKVTDAITRVLQPGSDGAYDIEYTIKNPQTNEERIVVAKGKALFNADGIAYRFSGTLQDITERIIARKQVEKSEQQFRNMVKQVAVGIATFEGPTFIAEMANETYLQIIDKTESSFIGRPLYDSLPEVKDSVGPLLSGVLHTGIPYYGTEFPVTINRSGKAEITYFNFVYQPFKEEDGTVTGVTVVASDVTPSIIAKQALLESEKQFRNLIQQSPTPMAIFRGSDLIIETANKVMFEKLWRRKESELIGKKLIDAFPELVGQKYPELLKKVFETGIAHRENESIGYVEGDDGMKKFYFDYEYAALFDSNHDVSGIIITVNDVTEKVEARQRVEEAEERLRLAVEATGLANWELNLYNQQIIHSPRLAEIFGHDASTILSHQEMLNQIHPDDLHSILKIAYERAMVTGTYYYEARVIKPDHSTCWIKTQGNVFYDNEKLPYKLVGTLQDITEEKYHQQELQESEQKFRLLADSMPQFIWTGAADGNLNYYNKSVYNYSGLSPAQIHEGGWLQIVHPDDQEENIKKWMEAVATGKDFLFEHRFRRYDDEYRWQLSRAVPQRDANGNIQMWVGTSTDIQEQKTFAQELEKQVQERTKEIEVKNRELEHMNEELKSFAYVSSHDLQEPLRKIQTFASRIFDKEIDTLSEKAKDYLARMQEAANRMQTLIEDLLTYSRTNSSERIFSHADLNKIVDEVKNDFKETLAEQHATIEASPMCEANIIPFQFRQLMQNLIGNSLKFSKKDEPPHIQIKSEKIKGDQLHIDNLSPQKEYCHISVSDNGIGFEPQYKERIFEVFQRLHNRSDYKGTGIGLAIVKKIVENHNGVITATSELNKGTTFDIYIPA